LTAEQQPSGAERRRSPRFESLNLVQCSVSTPGGEEIGCLGRTLDLSENGILLEIAQSMPSIPSLPDMVHLTIAIEDHIMETDGKIVHQKYEGTSPVAGIEFTSLSPEDRQHISGFLRGKGEAGD